MEFATDSATLGAIINHVFLPPKLPGGKDELHFEEQLVDSVVSSLEKFKEIEKGYYTALNVAVDALKNLKTVTPSCETVSAASLQSLLDSSTNGAVIPILVAAQNAAVFIETQKSCVIFEAFELSPRNEAAMSIKGRLLRRFPGSSVAIPLAKFQENGFTAALSSALAKMSTQSVPEMAPQARKAGQEHDESRDTINPTIVTGFLANFMMAHGTAAESLGIMKNTREEVVLSSGYEFPWRRSPLWLLIRVLLQLTLNRLSSEDLAPNFVYKRFMVFFMAQIQSSSLALGLPTATISIINAKIAQRHLKLRPAVCESWVSPVLSIVREATQTLEQRARHMIAANKRPLDTSGILHPDMDTDLRMNLPELDKFIQSIPNRAVSTNQACFKPISSFRDVATLALPQVWAQSANDSDQAHNLIAIEDWVDSNLDSWVVSHSQNEASCGMLYKLILDYHRLARRLYSDHPQSTSRMLLTVLELWIACDKSCIERCPLIAQYDPEIPMSFWEMLLLRSKRDLDRLHEAEEYLARGRCMPGHQTSIWCAFGAPGSFALRYYDNSVDHQALKIRIENYATIQREAKAFELTQLKNKYESLISQAAAIPCKYKENKYGRPQHAKGCAKCKLNRQAKDMTIEVHEWPLPLSQTLSQAVVFETSLPTYFSAWRDCTLTFKTDILGYQHVEGSAPSPAFHLQSYEGLGQFFVPPGRDQRVSLVSQSKPHKQTHRKSVKVSCATEHSVCLANGLIWETHDHGANRVIGAFKQPAKIYDKCIFRLPETLSQLQKYLRRTPDRSKDPTPNTVIATQTECPYDMTLAAYKDLCTMPLGYNIQWMSVLTQLAMPSIDWKGPETLIFIWQIVGQTGPRTGDWPRVSHATLQDESLVSQMLIHLELSLEWIRHSWESSKAVAVYSTIAAHVLSVGHPTCIKPCLSFLSNCQTACLHWMRVLKDSMQSAYDEAKRTAFMVKCHEVALIYASCFDIDSHRLESLLRSPRVLAEFFECSMTIEETQRPLKSTDIIFKTMTHRWQRCIHKLSRRLMRSPPRMEDAEALDIAVSRKWEPYRRSCSQDWELVSTCWMGTLAKAANDADAIPVHFNLLTAQLLINGLPLSRFPSQYESHPSYRILFQDSVLSCSPSTNPGMELQAGRRFGGNELHFGLQMNPSGKAESDMLLTAIAVGSVAELVPPRLLKSSLPYSFVDNYVHWYNASTDSVTLRLKSQPWDSSNRAWTLRRQGGHWRLRCSSDVALVNPFSTVAQRCDKIFKPLEHLMGLHIIYSLLEHRLTINIPRLNLEFCTTSTSNVLSSMRYPHMHVDTRQDFDTLIGLENKLVLCQDGDPGVRTVLIPEGEVTAARFRPGSPQEHSVVTIGYTATRLQMYQLNHHLGVLEGSGSLQSKLFLAYLHALTSYPVPDPFTQHTGTEQSLSILRSGGVRSFDVLSLENVAVLEHIAKLTPHREYYPKHLRVMQRITWSKQMCPLSQHFDFIAVVQGLLNQAEETAFLYPHIERKLPSLLLPQEDLAVRDSIRCTTFRIHGFGAEAFSAHFDKPYESRDGSRCERLSRVFETCKALLYSRVPDLDPGSRNIQFCDQLWSFFNNPLGTTGLSQAMAQSELSYDEKWLKSHEMTLPNKWCQTHATIQRDIATMNRVQLRLWISTLAFSKKANEPILQALVSIVIDAQVRDVEIPSEPLFHLNYGTVFDRQALESGIRQAMQPFELCPEARLEAEVNETRYEAANRRERTWVENSSRAVSVALEYFHGQWFSHAVGSQDPPNSIDTYVDRAVASASVQAMFKKWTDNIAFKHYLQAISNGIESIHRVAKRYSEPSRLTFPQRAPCHLRAVNIDTVFELVAPPARKEQSSGHELGRFTVPVTAESQSRLHSFLRGFTIAGKSEMEARYMEALTQSASSLRNHSPQHKFTGSKSELHECIIRQVLSANSEFETILQALKELLAIPAPTNHASGAQEMMCLRVAAATHQWPRWSTTVFLQQLRHKRRNSLPEAWRGCLIYFARTLEALQWAQRLWVLKDQDADLLKELHNNGSDVWDKEEHLDSLLMEVEANFRTRGIQGEIAHTMRDPPHGSNTGVQLNMGEGKSSTIAPSVACSLADGSRLPMVIVAKPQARQMYEMLVSKIGALVDRRIFHLPFSRTTQINWTQAQSIYQICRDCISSGGILLVQPEHILSLQLMTIESFYRGDLVLGRQMLEIRELLMEKARYIVDESDENFSPKFELIYTIGHQQSIEYAPQRWVIIHEILDQAVKVARKIKKQMPSSLEIASDLKGTFPRIRILDKRGQEALSNVLAKHICKYGLASFPVARQTQGTSNTIFRYITHHSLTRAEVDAVELSTFWTSTTRNTLLLLRGLFAKGILVFALANKRWRVNYGLDPNRMPETRLVVPYRAKDSPSPRSEFSHPDVVIILTSLSYYYGGLSVAQLFATMYHLQSSDQAAEEYQFWMSSTESMPHGFRHLEGVNLKDQTQCEEVVFPHLRRLKPTIDYFLSRIIFTKEMKEFPHKLSASGWDLGAVKAQPMTGFSGTNDSQHLLPLDVKQLDLESQRHTNALVLENLLEPSNSVLLMPELSSESSGHGWGFLRRVSEMDPSIRVILDVGAQIIDLNNQEVAAAWLEITKGRPDISAVVFCDQNDEVCVLDRQGRVEHLLISAFNKKLDACLVFLDEAHTRGIDLRLPQTYRAAVTLGANLTKDRLVQACMRMRKLGAGQTVVFCIPSEIEQRICSLMPEPHTPIETAHVLRWAIWETLADLKRTMPLWANQGQCFHRQSDLWEQVKERGTMDQELANRFLDNDAPSLETRYRPSGISASIDSRDKAIDSRALRIIQRCDEFEVYDFESATLQEEQERELEPEAEQERYVERPPAAQPAKHSVHKHVRRFVETGVIDRADKAFMPAFESLANTTAAERLDMTQIPADLWVTGDFAHAIQHSGLKRTKLDAFQRDVRWVLTTQQNRSVGVDMVVISPFEADQLFPLIKASIAVRLHIYAPRQNRGYAPIDHLSLYTLPPARSTSDRTVLPPRAIIGLNLFAGQLYFSSFAEYTRVCDYLCLSWCATAGERQVRPDGFIEPQYRQESEAPEMGFQASPVPFFQALMGGVRRQCGGIEKTHMGRLMEGALLRNIDLDEDVDG